MSLLRQLDRLLEAGVAEAAGITVPELAGYADALSDEPNAMLAVHPALASARQLAPLLRRYDKPGFVVGDLTDLEQFVPIRGLALPDCPLYLIHDPDRGDKMRNWSPDEALPALVAQGQTPLTLNEGISWLLQEPEVLEPNHCFMTIGSRRTKGDRLDARTPAIGISSGTGHDGATRRGAPRSAGAGPATATPGWASPQHATAVLSRPVNGGRTLTPWRRLRTDPSTAG